MAEEGCTAQLPQADPFCQASVTQPFPPSPNTVRKTQATPNNPKEQLSNWLDQLEKESKKTEAHMASLKKRQVNLTTNLEVMEQQVQERFETMRLALEKDELAVLNSLQQEHRENSSKLSRVLQDWNQHLKLVRKHISTIKKLQEDKAEFQQEVCCKEFSCFKKQDSTEVAMKLNEEKFQKLIKVLGKISKDLQVHLQRKSLLLDSTVVGIDKTASHRQIQITNKHKQCMHLSPDDISLQDHPLQFDKIYCALGLPAITTGQHYWEVDVHCCSAWAVGVAYGSLQRKGHDKSTKLGRNRLSWSLEFRDGHLLAWHNDRQVALDKVSRTEKGVIEKLGVLVNYQKGRIIFYDADSMKMLQEFSTTCTNVFDRAHHTFTEPIFPAFRFFKLGEQHAVPDHIEICDLSL